MRIIFELGHPAHVHLFKNIIRNLQNKNEIKIVIREREGMVKKLLEIYDFKYESLEETKKSLFLKAIGILKNDYKLLKIANEFCPEIFVSITTPYSALVSKFKNKPYIAFTDSEPTKLILSLSVPFANAVITPYELKKDFGKKHIRIKGYKELAYLHPNRFKPEKDVLNFLNVREGEKYVILRFNAFAASHDIGIRGFTIENKRKLVEECSKFAKVFISSELELPDDLKQYQIKIPIEKMHSALYYANLLITDCQTSTTESAILGTPVVRSNKFVLNDMSNFIELEKKYGLIFNIADGEKAIEKALELIKIENLKEQWKIKKEKMLKEKIDVSAFFIWFIENYPESFKIMKEDNEYQNRFMNF